MCVCRVSVCAVCQCVPCVSVCRAGGGGGQILCNCVCVQCFGNVRFDSVCIL